MHWDFTFFITKCDARYFLSFIFICLNMQLLVLVWDGSRLLNIQFCSYQKSTTNAYISIIFVWHIKLDTTCASFCFKSLSFYFTDITTFDSTLEFVALTVYIYLWLKVRFHVNPILCSCVVSLSDSVVLWKSCGSTELVIDALMSTCISMKHHSTQQYHSDPLQYERKV